MSPKSISSYTNTLSTYELMEMFPTDVSARNYFETQLWGDSPRCPNCSNQRSETTLKSYA